MWGPRGSHADSAPRRPKPGSKPPKDLGYTASPLHVAQTARQLVGDDDRILLGDQLPPGALVEEAAAVLVGRWPPQNVPPHRHLNPVSPTFLRHVAHRFASGCSPVAGDEEEYDVSAAAAADDATATRHLVLSSGLAKAQKPPYSRLAVAFPAAAADAEEEEGATPATVSLAIAFSAAADAEEEEDATATLSLVLFSGLAKAKKPPCSRLAVASPAAAVVAEEEEEGATATATLLEMVPQRWKGAAAAVVPALSSLPFPRLRAAWCRGLAQCRQADQKISSRSHGGHLAISFLHRDGETARSELKHADDAPPLNTDGNHWHYRRRSREDEAAPLSPSSIRGSPIRRNISIQIPSPGTRTCCGSVDRTIVATEEGCDRAYGDRAYGEGRLRWRPGGDKDSRRAA
uniref:Uncharacterized protein n=1 Tax=Oryza barthii TaxID=65489 RepID=A0A0D3FQ24_9ORYZ